MSGGNTLPPGSLSNFGLDLSGHHPVSFPYPQRASQRGAAGVAPDRSHLRRVGRGPLHHLPRPAQGPLRQVPDQGQPILGVVHDLPSAHRLARVGPCHVDDVGRRDLAQGAEDLADLHHALRMGLRGVPHAALRPDRGVPPQFHRRTTGLFVHDLRVPRIVAGYAPRRDQPVRGHRSPGSKDLGAPRTARNGQRNAESERAVAGRRRPRRQLLRMPQPSRRQHRGNESPVRLGPPARRCAESTGTAAPWRPSPTSTRSASSATATPPPTSTSCPASSPPRTPGCLSPSRTRRITRSSASGRT